MRSSTIYFKVSDIQSTDSEPEAKGARFVATPHVVNRSPKAELWLAEFKDPDGNQLALMAKVVIDG